MEEKLIEGIEIQEDRVTIVQGENRFVLPPEQATTFLIGMLQGRSWFIEPEEPATPELLAEEEEVPAVRDPSTSFHESLEGALDSLLTFTKEVGIVEDFEKHAQSETVSIDIRACSTTLSYGDALGYLLDCVQDELRTLRGEE